jgi:cytosine/adenosine deaminase-related metal-dependent hydrolase
MIFKGELITHEGEVLRGELVVERDGFYFEEREVEPEYVFTPTFFNAHTHLGDSVAKDPEFTSLENLVGPSGFKFKVLSNSSDDEIVNAMRRSIEFARSTGTSAMLDFREGGLRGFELLRRADERKICKPLTRPSSLEEAEKLAEVSFGFGMSSTRDHDLRFLEELRDLAKRKKVLFAIHAGERDPEDVDDALALEPDLLIHMNMAEADQLKSAMDEGIPIVSCIRSNAFFGLLNSKNYELLARYDRWLIGTDNVMIAKPSMLEEMHFVAFLLRNDLQVFKAVVRGFDLFGIDGGLVVFHRRQNLYKTRNPLASIVRRAGFEDIELVLLRR